MTTLKIGLATLLLSLSAVAWADATSDFAALLEEHWEWTLRNSPTFASSLGDHRYDDRWRDESLAAYETRHDERKEFLRRLYAIERAALSDADRLNYELFRRELQDDVDLYQFGGHLMPFFHRGGVQNLENTTNRLRVQTLQDYENWLARMGKVDELIDQRIKLAEAGRKADIIAPKVLMQRITSQLSLQLVENAEDSPFYRVFQDMPNSIPAEEQERLRSAARETIEDTVLPAYRKLDRYFNDRYLPASRDSIGKSALPNG